MYVQVQVHELGLGKQCQWENALVLRFRGRGEKNKKEKKIQKKDKTFLSYPKNLVKKYKPVKNEITYNWKETNQ